MRQIDLVSKYPKFVDDFNSVLEEAHKMCFITRDAQIQTETIDFLIDFQSRLSSLKAESVDQGKEDAANMLLGFECVTRTIRSELGMYLLLKKEQPDDAWRELINAQYAALGAIRAHQGFSHLENKVLQLEAIEELVFPPQVFLSAGMTLHDVECSVCNESYLECDHVKGKPYMGELCGFIIKEASLDEVSIVDEPADKRCRVTHFGSRDGTQNRNRMTWRIEE